MNNISVHMRISGVTVSDDEVISRRSSATNLAKVWGKVKAPLDIIAKVAEVAESLAGDGVPPDSLGEEVQRSIQTKSPSFLYEERPLDVGVCAGMAMVSMFSDPQTTGDLLIKDVYAAALWSSLAYQPVLESERRENLRREVLDTARIWVSNASEISRKRFEVPNPATLNIKIDPTNVATSNFNDAILSTVEALRRNAALDREELDYLWWAQLGRSRLLNKQLSAIPETVRIVASGIEGAKMLRRLPCEVHREIVLRTLEQDFELNLHELLEQILDDRLALIEALNVSIIAANPIVFPLLNALITGEAEGAGASVKRHVSEWGERALFESTLSRMVSEGAR